MDWLRKTWGSEALLCVSIVALYCGIVPSVALEPASKRPVGATSQTTQAILSVAQDPRPAPNYVFTFQPLTPETPQSQGSRARFDPDDDFFGLPREGAYELVDAYCSGCHSLQIVMQQRASKDRWATLLEWMETKQNMPSLEEDEAAVLAYLAEHFGAR